MKQPSTNKTIDHCYEERESMDYIKRHLSEIVIGLLTSLIAVIGFFVIRTLHEYDDRPTASEVQVMIQDELKPIREDISDNRALILTIKDMKRGIEKISVNQIKTGKDVAIIKDRLNIITSD